MLQQADIFWKSGSHLLSHAVSSIVPSAVWVLTIVFGMGTGVSPRRIATGIYVLGKSPLGITLLRAPSSGILASLTLKQQSNPYFFFPRKEVIQPHLPIRLPCYDFTPVIRPAFGCSLLSVGSQTSGISDSHGVTGGVYKTRERIHRGILIRDY